MILNIMLFRIKIPDDGTVRQRATNIYYSSKHTYMTSQKNLIITL